MKTIRVLIAACALLCFGAAVALAAPIGRPDVPTLLKKVDSFAFVMDTSGSMMMASENDLGAEPKIFMAKRLVGEINDRIPALDYKAGLFTACPATTAVQMGDWNRLAYGNAVAAIRGNLPTFGRMTPLGKDITALQPSLNLRNGALILVTDGWKNLGADTIASFRSVLQATGAKLHVISFADAKEGQTIVTQLGGLQSDPCYNARELLFNPVALDAFVKHVFYDEAVPMIMPTVYFNTAKWDLLPEAIATLDQAVATINNAPRGVRTVHVEGYADAQGGVGTANQVLSSRRANAVREYLESKGVPAQKLYTRGNNVSFKYNNATIPGRHDNRRVDLIIN
ncbi:MAG: OmpA family protein [Deltaproteobacteria bacterium]|nr:OmpA family protein [Deltaproteobacteria bacterium]